MGSAGGTVLVGGHAEVFLHVLAEETETDENRRSVSAHDDSGLPGTLLTFNRYRYPCAHNHLLTAISGLVALLRICDMQR